MIAQIAPVREHADAFEFEVSPPPSAGPCYNLISSAGERLGKAKARDARYQEFERARHAPQRDVKRRGGSWLDERAESVSERPTASIGQRCLCIIIFESIAGKGRLLRLRYEVSPRIRAVVTAA